MSPVRVSLSLLAVLGLAACEDGGDPSEDPGEELLAPPEPGEGVQFAMKTTLEPGVEAEHCQFFKAPDEPMWVSRDEIRFDQGSHHVLLYETPYDEIPTMTTGGRAVDTSGVFDCTSGATDGWDVIKLAAGSQNGQGDSMIKFPPGVAMPVRGGAVMLMNVHYINASDEVLEPEARINLYTVPAEEVQTEGDLLFLYNPIIRVPANGTSRAHWRCPVHQDITLVNAQSHMHARGVGYAAAIAGQEPFYESDRWSNVEVKDFGDGLPIPAGSRFDYYCDYRSSEDHDVYQGPRSTDEMCMLIGSYYPADVRISNCLNEDGSEQSGEWVGEGTATCAETMSCVLSVDTGDLDVLQPLTECILASDPSVSRELSDFVRCALFRSNPQEDCAAVAAACEAK